VLYHLSFIIKLAIINNRNIVRNSNERIWRGMLFEPMADLGSYNSKELAITISFLFQRLVGCSISHPDELVGLELCYGSKEWTQMFAATMLVDDAFDILVDESIIHSGSVWHV